MNKLLSSLRTMMSVVVLAAIVSSALAGPAYTVTDLGTLGGSESYGYGINSAGQVTGESTTSDGLVRAFLYSNGTMTDLGSLGGAESAGRGINDAGQVTGHSRITPGGHSHAFVYTNGIMTDLDADAFGSGSSGYGINNAGQVTGGFMPPLGGQEHAFLYSNGAITDLGTLGGLASRGLGINNAGQVTGYSLNSSGHFRGFIYSGGTMTDLGTLGELFSSSGGHAINNAGHVAGNSESFAFLYRNGSMTNLGTLPNGTVSIGHAINDFDQITGTSYTLSASGWHAFLYSSSVMIDLNDLIDPASGWKLYEGNGINNAGQITGYGTISGQYHAFLLTPIPEPEIYAMLIFGLGMIGLLARRRSVNT
jgi:probable HAF family extracellular repeat protein